MIASVISRASAAVLAASGLALLFASDVILPVLVHGVPASAAWLGQLLAAAWLGVAALDWTGRQMLLGGIYGRSTVLANTVLYFVGALVLLRVLMAGRVSTATGVSFIVMAIFACLYGWLLLRGPFARDLALSRAAHAG